ncbi:DNA adenine methylase [Lutibacter maritimus]|uniref:DNA adenine methylase n=1 Tax=Lutibacter maritimus TaxID=593133 RepID=A0A1I6NRF7_9FLAO|nr:DNA adenine methylase [Lutibacter maritimus]SFS30582.1 DNA adenine methylase [Lutibacter maritimus]
MVLTRVGNKRKMKTQLQTYFPEHKMRIELFFGAGGSFFYLPAPKYAILNDFDDDVTNLYLVILNNKEELIKQIQLMPISESLIKHWKVNLEIDPMKKALRFLLLSNFTYLGKGDTLRLGLDNAKKILIKNIEPTFLKLQNVKLTTCDFRNVIPKISFSKKLITKDEAFVYLDPVYLGTQHYYKVPSWKTSDTEDCFKIMATSGINCAMSEFYNEQVLDFASDYKMNVIYLKERKNIKNRKQEILITNYSKHQIAFNFN